MDLRQLADGLADAMLAGPPEMAGLRERCIAAVGGRPRWLPGLLKKVCAAHDGAWSANAGSALVETILAHPPLRRAASTGKPFELRRRYTPATAMAGLPSALADCVVPRFDNLPMLAAWLGLELEELQWLARSRPAVHSEHYGYRWLPKRRGGWRLLEMPKARLRSVQRRLLHGLLDYLPVHEAAHGFRVGHSIVSHAAQHAGQRVVLKMDVEDFFLGIRGARVNALFETLGYPVAVARALTALCTHAVPAQDLAREGLPDAEPPLPWMTRKRYGARHLPQGAPTSPALANLSAFAMDVRLMAAAERFDAQYSRYADDLTFSGGAALLRGIDRLVALVGAIAIDEGMAINFRKTRVMTSAQRQQVTGVVINRHPNLRRDQYDQLKATLHNCARRGPRAENRAGRADFRAHLQGRVAHAMMLNPLRGEKLERMLAAIDWDS